MPFATLELARALREEAGFDQKQADGTARVLARLLVADLVTKSDLSREIRESEPRLQTTIAETTAEIVKWVVGVAVAQAALLVAVLKAFPGGHP